MAIDNYNGLRASIISWCNQSKSNTVFVNQIPTFIALAEEEIAIESYALGAQISVLADLTFNVPYITRPANWLRTISISILQENTTPHYLQRQSLEYMDLYTEGQAVGDTRIPMYYTDYNSDLIAISPSPDRAYRFRLMYIVRIPALTFDRQTNWYSFNNPSLLFWNAMAKAQEFLGNSEEAARYAQKYRDRMNAVNSFSGQRLIDRYSDPTLREGSTGSQQQEQQ